MHAHARLWFGVAAVALGATVARSGLAATEEPGPVRVGSGPHGRSAIALTPGTTLFGAMRGGSDAARPLTRLVSPDPDRVIIELRGAPLFRRPAGSALAPQAAMQAMALQHASVATEIVRIASLGTGRALKRAEVIRYEFSRVFNGFAARLSPEAQRHIRLLPDVVEVHPDLEVRATLDTSVPLVAAPQFWSTYAYRGAGTVIAVVDTGVDYAHPDLGGCLGAGCKVSGGFDFANGDGDPRDDHGHGTHVASIAAGNGARVGVAPDASLLAYKVLDAAGLGADSSVIAGIERAVDPDQDGDPADRAAVINLSLGRAGDPDDPLAQAVDGATAAGVVVAAAAGNAYDFFTIGSPGAARSALTVGATDDTDQIAPFSSRGPSARIYGLKPEMTAPGVDICAAQAGGTTLGPACLDGHVALSGTSMATPHVAGAAALLRGLYPERTPDEIKSLLVQNSQDVGLEALVGGAGRLDVVAAAAARAVVTPAAVSFGLDDLALPTWTASQSFTVRNVTALRRLYTLTTTGLPPGITAQLTPASFRLPAGEATTVTLDLSVDNAVVPTLPSPPHAYAGTVDIRSGTRSQRLPFVFIKAAQLRLRFDQVPDSVVVHDRNAFGSAVIPVVPSADFLVPPGTYDVIVAFGAFDQPGIVVREGLVVDNVVDEFVARSEAIHEVAFSVLDERQQPLSPTVMGTFLVHRNSRLGVWRLQFGGTLPTSLMFAPLSSAYDLDQGYRAHAGAKLYLLTGGLGDGIASDRQLGSTGDNLTRGTVRYHPRPTEPRVGTVDVFDTRAGAFGFFGVYSDVLPVLTRELYVTPVPRRPFPFFMRVWAIDPDVSAIFPVHESHHMQGDTAPGTINVFNQSETLEPIYRTTTGELPLNLGPPCWFQRFQNAPTHVDLAPAISDPPFYFFSFLAQGGDAPEAPGLVVPWELRSGTTLIASGVLSQSAASGFQFNPIIPVPWAGRYTFVADGPPYRVGDLAGSTRVEATFDTSLSDPHPG